jgi:hypothetical protein
MRDFSSRLAARWIDAVRIHRTCRMTVDGVEGYLKERRFGMEVFLGPGNLFLRLSKSRIQMFSSVDKWREHEGSCFRLCHPERFFRYVGRRGLFMERLPGTTIRDLAAGSALEKVLLRHCAAELRRVHTLRRHCDGEPWSHGDPHLGNFLFDQRSARCYLIDFETEHLLGYTAIERQADDVLTFCLELVARPDEASALAESMVFLEAYGVPEVLGAVGVRLTLPSGFERVLWATRTHYLSADVLRRRLDALRSRLEGS